MLALKLKSLILVLSCLGEDATKIDSVLKSLLDHTCRSVENWLIHTFMFFDATLGLKCSAVVLYHDSGLANKLTACRALV